MSAHDNLMANISKVSFANLFETDRVFNMAEGTIAVNGVSGAQFAVAWNFLTTRYSVFGLWSLDGISWYNMSSVSSELQTSNTSFIWAYTYVADNITEVVAYIRNPSSPATTHTGTVFYKIYAYANALTTTIGGVGDFGGTPTGFDSRNITRKIYLDDSASFNYGPGGATVSVLHNLGYIPTVDAFIQDGNNNFPLSDTWIETRMTETTVDFVLTADVATFASLPAKTVVLYYRIYLEE